MFLADKTKKNEENNVLSISSALRTARLRNAFFDRFPGRLPTSLEQAYAIQNQSIIDWQDTISGWKVGGIATPFDTKLNSSRLVGPIFTRSIQTARRQHPNIMPVFAQGFAAVEAEFVVQLLDCATFDLQSTSIDQTTKFIRSVHIGAEIASSPLRDINGIGPMAVISDFGNNYGLVIGPEFRDWNPDSLSEILVTTSIDERIVGSRTAELGEKGPIGAVDFLIRHLHAQGKTNTDGLFVSTGAITGIHEMELGSIAVVRFEHIGEFSVTFSNAQIAPNNERT